MGAPLRDQAGVLRRSRQLHVLMYNNRALTTALILNTWVRNFMALLEYVQRLDGYMSAICLCSALQSILFDVNVSIQQVFGLLGPMQSRTPT